MTEHCRTYFITNLPQCSYDFSEPENAQLIIVSKHSRSFLSDGIWTDIIWWECLLSFAFSSEILLSFEFVFWLKSKMFKSWLPE